MGIFTNANKIMIGGKEVQSLKIGNNTLYEKASGESNILFEDDCSSNQGLSNYRTPININYSSIYGSPQLTYDSTNDCYAFTNNSTYDYLIYQIPKLDGKTNFTFSCECKLDNNNSIYVGLGVMPSESNLSTTYAEIMYAYYRSSTKVYNYVRRMRREATFTSITTGNSNQAPSSWFKLEMVMDNSNNVTFNFKTLSNTTFKTVSSTISANAARLYP